MRNILSVSIALGIGSSVGAAALLAADGPPIETISGKDRYEVNAYPSIATLHDGRLLCVFSAIDPKRTDGKAVIVGMLSENHGKTWGEPRVLIDSRPELDYDPSLIVIGPRVIVSSTTVPTTHGQFISTSRTVAVRSDDNGKTWSKAYEIPMGHRYTAGKINNGIVLRDGTALLPFAWDANLENATKLAGEGQQECRSNTLVSKDKGMTWKLGGDAVLDKRKLADREHAINGLDEPAIVECSDGSVYMLGRTGLDKLFETRSKDGGKTWSSPQPSALTSHNAPASLCPFKAQGKTGILAVWCNSPKNRWPLCVAASTDDARTWTTPKVVASVPGHQSSYPGCTQAADGTLVVVWQQDLEGGGREIRSIHFPADWVLSAMPTRPVP